jgi:hypothetical protein
MLAGLTHVTAPVTRACMWARSSRQRDAQAGLSLPPFAGNASDLAKSRLNPDDVVDMERPVALPGQRHDVYR